MASKIQSSIWVMQFGIPIIYRRQAGSWLRMEHRGELWPRHTNQGVMNTQGTLTAKGLSQLEGCKERSGPELSLKGFLC